MFLMYTSERADMPSRPYGPHLKECVALPWSGQLARNCRLTKTWTTPAEVVEVVGGRDLGPPTADGRRHGGRGRQSPAGQAESGSAGADQ
jgi:hypothetical protein